MFKQLISLLKSGQRLRESITVGTPIAITGTPMVSIPIAIFGFPIPLPGDIPVSHICIVRPSRSGEFDAMESIADRKSVV